MIDRWGAFVGRRALAVLLLGVLLTLGAGAFGAGGAAEGRAQALVGEHDLARLVAEAAIALVGQQVRVGGDAQVRVALGARERQDGRRVVAVQAGHAVAQQLPVHAVVGVVVERDVQDLGLDQHLPAGWTAHILATDVSTQMLERVEAGRYSQVEVNRGLPATSLVKYFSRVGSEWEVSADLKRMVRTQHLNLAAPFPLLPTFDIVFLRNVLIYFDLETKRDILGRVHRTVAPDGFLLLGSSETTLDMDDHWDRESHDRVQLHRTIATHHAPPAGTVGWHRTAMTGA